jgi:hypothetical protein
VGYSGSVAKVLPDSGVQVALRSPTHAPFTSWYLSAASEKVIKMAAALRGAVVRAAPFQQVRQLMQIAVPNNVYRVTE